MNVRDLVMIRSGGRCEAVIRLPRTWTRCGKSGVEDHHLLTRGRGGEALDRVGETYHHLALCPNHHRLVDDMGFESGLLIQGYAYTDHEGKAVYVGPDEYLSATYPEVRVPVVQEEVRSPIPDPVARGAL